MNTKTRLALISTLVLLGGAALAAAVRATPGTAPLAPGGSPAMVAYQGEVQVGGTPYDGSGYFKFAVVDVGGASTYWSNDGSSTAGGEPDAAVQLNVSEGLFGVLLGDTSLGGMTQTLAAGVFSQPDRYLRVWFSSDNSTFDQLAPDTRIAAVPYALQAQEAADAGTVDGYEGADLEESSEIDADITVHAAISDAHHARYTDAEAWSAVLDADGPDSGLDADTVDGHEGADLEESSEIDADIAAHAAISDAHHARYTDAETWSAVLAADGPGSGLDADTVDGVHAGDLGSHYQNVVVVAKSGGDYASIQAGIDSIPDAAVDNAYLVWVAPGVYSETVTMRPHIHLQGAGQELTVITSTASSSGFSPNEATLMLTRATSLRDLTVGNGGTEMHNVALMATDGTTQTLVADVTARAMQEAFTNNYAIYLTGSGTSVTLQNVTALAGNGDSLNCGVYNTDGAAVTLRGGTFTGRGGTSALGIQNRFSATLEAEGITALGENGYNGSYGLQNGGADAVLYGGSFTARGGNGQCGGIHSWGSSLGSTLEATDITARGENCSELNYGLYNNTGTSTMLRGGSFTGRGGDYTWGIRNDGSNTTLDAEGVVALGENGGVNSGLWNVNNTQATVRGGSFTGRGGTSACGINNSASDTTLEADSVTALGEDGSTNNYGLNNFNGAAAALHGGSFTGRGGSVDTYGIHNSDSGTTLEAANVTTVGENNSFYNFGLHNENGAEAILRGSSFIGIGGQFAHGIANGDSGTVLKAEGVTALGENSSDTSYGMLNRDSATATLDGGTFTARTAVTSTYGIINSGTLEVENVTALAENGGSNYGLHNSGGTTKADNSQFTGSSNGLTLDGGTVYLGLSQLDGGATNSSGTLICFQVYDGSYSAYTCP